MHLHPFVWMAEWQQFYVLLAVSVFQILKTHTLCTDICRSHLQVKVEVPSYSILVLFYLKPSCFGGLPYVYAKEYTALRLQFYLTKHVPKSYTEQTHFVKQSRIAEQLHKICRRERGRGSGV